MPNFLRLPHFQESINHQFCFFPGKKPDLHVAISDHLFRCANMTIKLKSKKISKPIPFL